MLEEGYFRVRGCAGTPHATSASVRVSSANLQIPAFDNEEHCTLDYGIGGEVSAKLATPKTEYKEFKWMETQFSCLLSAFLF